VDNSLVEGRVRSGLGILLPHTWFDLICVIPIWIWDSLRVSEDGVGQLLNVLTVDRVDSSGGCEQLSDVAGGIVAIEGDCIDDISILVMVYGLLVFPRMIMSVTWEYLLTFG
jgi:hypothetical protein